MIYNLIYIYIYKLNQDVWPYRSVNGPLLNLIDLFAGLVLLTLALFEDPAGTNLASSVH